MKRITLALAIALFSAHAEAVTCPSPAPDQSCPSFTFGITPTPQQWTNWFSSRQPALGFTIGIGQYPGTSTSDSAVAGNIGELLTASLVSGSATSLSTTVAKNVTSVGVSPGDWDCDGQVDYSLTSATTSHFKSGLSASSGTFAGQDTFADQPLILTTTTDTFGHRIPRQRFSFSSSSTVWLIAQATFSAGSEAAYGTIYCRRVR